MPDEGSHRHAIICMLGYQQQNSNLTHEWAGLLNFCKVRNIPVFGLRWEAGDNDSLLDNII